MQTGARGAPPAAEPSLAARQVAGFALPTRSVHALANVPPRREPDPRPIGKARAARSAFSFTTALALITFAAASLAWVARQPRFVLEVPTGTSDRLDHIAALSATGAVAALLLGLVAMAAWCVRAAVRTWRRRDA